MTTTVLVAGASGMLGNRVAAHLLDQSDTDVRLLLRESVPSDPGKAATIRALTDRGAVVVVGDVTDPSSLADATEGGGHRGVCAAGRRGRPRQRAGGARHSCR